MATHSHEPKGPKNGKDDNKKQERSDREERIEKSEKSEKTPLVNTEALKEKFNDTLHALKHNEKFEDIYQAATSNYRDTIAYIILLIGIVLLFFQPFYGGVLVGIIAAIYFAPELTEIATDFANLVEKQGIVRSLIFGGVLLAFFICAPAIFIGAFVTIAVKQFLFPNGAKGSKSSKS